MPSKKKPQPRPNKPGVVRKSDRGDEFTGPGPQLYVPQNVAKILHWVSQGYTPSGAASKVGISAIAVANWRARYPEFAVELAKAQEIGTDFLEDEARRRAVEGVDKPVFYQGHECGHVREFSDMLLAQMLRSRNRFTSGGDPNKEDGPILVSEVRRVIVDAPNNIEERTRALLEDKSGGRGQ